MQLWRGYHKCIYESDEAASVGLNLGLKDFIRSAWNTLKLARKSTREEFLLYLKLVFIGLFAVGAIGFLILFVSSLIKLG